MSEMMQGKMKSGKKMKGGKNANEPQLDVGE